MWLFLCYVIWSLCTEVWTCRRITSSWHRKRKFAIPMRNMCEEGLSFKGSHHGAEGEGKFSLNLIFTSNNLFQLWFLQNCFHSLSACLSVCHELMINKKKKQQKHTHTHDLYELYELFCWPWKLTLKSFIFTWINNAPEIFFICPLPFCFLSSNLESKHVSTKR